MRICETKSTAAPACPNNPQVAAEVAAGQGLRLVQAARRFPAFRRKRAGDQPDAPLGDPRPVSPATVWRWITDGVRVPDSETVVRLEAVRTPCGWLTSEPAIVRFLAAITPQSANTTQSP
jgi:hypothetical protein